MRAAFVPTQAGPLAGDADHARIVVRAGAVLAVEPVAATLALPGAARTLLSLDVLVESGGRLVLDEAPLIVAHGARVRRRVSIALAAGAVVASRETIVLGRDGEPPGELVSELRVTIDGRALLHDALRVGPHAADDYVALAPGHRVVSTICLLGERPAIVEPGTPLAGPGGLLRASGPSLAEVEAAGAATWDAWADCATERGAAPAARACC